MAYKRQSNNTSCNGAMLCSRRVGSVLLLFIFALALGACELDAGGNDSQPDGQADTEEDGLNLPPFTALPGSIWRWGQSVLEFTEDAVIYRGDIALPYAYTVETMEANAAGSGSIATLGDFTVNAERTILELLNYRNNYQGPPSDPAGITRPYNAVFKRKNPGALVIPAATLVGTEWNVGGQGGGDDGGRFKQCQWIIFFTATEAVNQSGGGVFMDAYTFDPATNRGWIQFINNFQIQDNGETMYIPSYKQYGHDMYCARVH